MFRQSNVSIVSNADKISAIDALNKDNITPKAAYLTPDNIAVIHFLRTHDFKITEAYLTPEGKQYIDFLHYTAQKTPSSDLLSKEANPVLASTREHNQKARVFFDTLSDGLGVLEKSAKALNLNISEPIKLFRGLVMLESRIHFSEQDVAGNFIKSKQIKLVTHMLKHTTEASELENRIAGFCGGVTKIGVDVTLSLGFAVFRIPQLVNASIYATAAIRAATAVSYAEMAQCLTSELANISAHFVEEFVHFSFREERKRQTHFDSSQMLPPDYAGFDVPYIPLHLLQQEKLQQESNQAPQEESAAEKFQQYRDVATLFNTRTQSRPSKDGTTPLTDTQIVTAKKLLTNVSVALSHFKQPQSDRSVGDLMPHSTYLLEQSILETSMPEPLTAQPQLSIQTAVVDWRGCSEVHTPQQNFQSQLQTMASTYHKPQMSSSLVLSDRVTNLSLNAATPFRDPFQQRLQDIASVHAINSMWSTLNTPKSNILRQPSKKNHTDLHSELMCVSLPKGPTYQHATHTVQETQDFLWNASTSALRK